MGNRGAGQGDPPAREFAQPVLPAHAEPAAELGKTYRALREELGKAIIGQEQVIELLAIALFAKGHALLMGVPG